MKKHMGAKFPIPFTVLVQPTVTENQQFHWRASIKKSELDVLENVSKQTRVTTDAHGDHQIVNETI